MPATDSFERIVTGMAEAENMLRRVSSEKNEPVEETKCRRDEEN
jgi:hypothetical protein